MATRTSASSGMVNGEVSSSVSISCAPRCMLLPWQAWIRNTLGLPVRTDWSHPLNFRVISLMGRGFLSVPKTTPFFPWLRIEQMKASPCSRTCWGSTKLLPSHSFKLNFCSWDMSAREATNVSAWSIWSLFRSSHISTLKPRHLNTSAKLSAKNVIREKYLSTRY